MNAAELKAHFYKRFTGESGIVTFARAGLPCSLLGYINTEHMPSIGCAASMSVRAAARRIGSGTVVITSTETDACRSYPINGGMGTDTVSVFLSRARGINGMQILSDNAIPECFNIETPYTAAIAHTVLELSKYGKPRDELCAALCSQKGRLNEYLTVFASDKGYAVYAYNAAARRLPLPMTGYKLIISAPKKNAPPVKPKVADRAYMNIKELYPHITSFADVSPQMLDVAAPRLRPKEIRLAAKHLTDECRRVSDGIKALTRCDIKAFARLMNESYYSQRRICAQKDERVVLADELTRSEGVIGARMFEQGVIAVADEDMCDEVIKAARFVYESEFGEQPVFCVADVI